ncbi:hypothetical protein ACOMHN_046243 [Nucella lapillus]
MAGRQKLQLTKEKHAEYIGIFAELDKDRNGWLSREEIGDWLKGAGYNLNHQQIERIFRLIDTNSDGRISLDEFLSAMDLIRNLPSETHDLLRVFRAMDTNSDGQLSQDELRQGLNNCGYNLSERQVKKIMTNLDKNNDGHVSFEEFVAYFK